VYHFKKKLDYFLNGCSENACIFFKNIATKSATRSSRLDSIIASVNTFTSAFKLNSINNEKVFVDFCVGATAYSDAEFGKVRVNYGYNFYLFIRSTFS